MNPSKFLISRDGSSSNMSHPSEYADILPTVRKLVSQVVARNLAEGILFSGGLDTSILAFELAKQKPVKTITVAFEQGKAKDLSFAQKMAPFLKIDHKIRSFDFEEMLCAAEKIILLLKVFDPMEVRNSLPVLIGLETAKKEKIQSVMTGDGLDELFLGYPWLFDFPLKKLKTRMEKMQETMRFSSTSLGSALGVEVETPFLDPLFKDFAATIGLNLKLNLKDGKKYGKWILRKAYENLIPPGLIWRDKTPLEEGTGTKVLSDLFEKKIEDEYFQEKKETYLHQDSVELLTKEQPFYYEIFRRVHGKPSDVYNKHGEECPNCKARVPQGSSFCRVCGAYPITKNANRSTA